MERERRETLRSHKESFLEGLGRISGELCSLAATICETPYGAVTLVEEDRQRFVATRGFQSDDIPRSASFCQFAIEDPDDVTTIEDALENDALRESPLVQEPPGFRFYAGALLSTREGHGIGTVCAMDEEPRGLTPQQRTCMGLLKRLGSTQIQLQRRTDELAQARDELVSTVEELDASNRDLVNFANVVSHEFKDPLSQIIGNLDLLEHTATEDLDDEAWELLEEAKLGAERLTRLLKDVLQFARAGQAEAKKEPLHVATLLDEVKTELQEAIQEAEASIETGPLPQAQGDPTMIRQVLKNLLSNAIKYRGEEPPRVRIAGEREEAMVRFSVEDNGIGISEEEQDRMFRVFERAEGVGDREGTGVGLALAQRIVERHGGEMGVESTPGEGSTFWFTLPVSVDPDEDQGPSVHASPRHDPDEIGLSTQRDPSVGPDD